MKYFYIIIIYFPTASLLSSILFCIPHFTSCSIPHSTPLAPPTHLSCVADDSGVPVVWQYTTCQCSCASVCWPVPWGRRWRRTSETCWNPCLQLDSTRSSPPPSRLSPWRFPGCSGKYRVRGSNRIIFKEFQDSDAEWLTEQQNEVEIIWTYTTVAPKIKFDQITNIFLECRKRPISITDGINIYEG